MPGAANRRRGAPGLRGPCPPGAAPRVGADQWLGHDSKDVTCPLSLGAKWLFLCGTHFLPFLGHSGVSVL